MHLLYNSSINIEVTAIQKCLKTDPFIDGGSIWKEIKSQVFIKMIFQPAVQYPETEKCSGDFSGIKNFVKNIHRNIIIDQKYPRKHNFSNFKS